MKRSFFQRETFNADFRVYGWEDIELGYRLFKHHGMRLFYAPKAYAYHHQVILPADLPKKMRAIGESAVHFQRLHPEAPVVPAGLKHRILKIATLPFVVALGRLFGKNIYYKLASWKAFLDGTSGIH